MVDEQDVAGLPLNRSGHTLAVLGAKDEGAQDEEIERALEQSDAVPGGIMGRHSTQGYTRRRRLSRGDRRSIRPGSGRDWKRLQA